jgi:hypothetical protein
LSAFKKFSLRRQGPGGRGFLAILDTFHRAMIRAAQNASKIPDRPHHPRAVAYIALKIFAADTKRVSRDTTGTDVEFPHFLG